MIHPNDERYWLYAAVDPDSNELPHTKPERARTNVLAQMFFAELREKHDVDDAEILIDGATPLKETCQRHALDFSYERHGNRNSVERIFREINDEQSVFLTDPGMPMQKQLKSGCDRSPSHGIA